MARIWQKIERPIVRQPDIELAWEIARKRFDERRKEKGYGSFVNTLEAWGSMDQEMRELKDEMHRKNYKNIESETIDKIVSLMWFLACQNAGGMEY